ncbi:C2H2-type domain-containing protein [Aphelenchoides besseyi]|nr:C2H2-type domain-containing protein [Aphelenchoides besseyi]KAI6237240.1 C2H2-type domain-containing protein [Aphelenchoides besseyi]
MATKKNGPAAEKNRDDEVGIEPILIDPDSLKRAVEEKARKDRLQSQESSKETTEANKPKTFNRQASSSSQQYKRQTSNDNKSANGADRTAKDRRQSYNRTKTGSKSRQSFDEKPGRVANNKTRSTSTVQSQDGGATSGEEKKRNRSSTTSNGKFRNKSYSVNSTGESFDYDDYDLEEPFSSDDDDTPRANQKPSLIIPRGRIRTLSGTVPPVGYAPKWGGPTMCLSCLQFFDLPDFIEKFSDHLLTEHQIVIEEVDLIVDPKRYVEHWRQRFAKQSIADVFPKIEPKEGDPFFGKVEYYFEMSERVSEDYALRQRLAMRRLEEALACQQREREDSSFSLPCIFCRYVARGNRSKIIHHLFCIHRLNLGSPDNLVFVHEYIEYLREKMNRNECIYCEKTFADRMILMEHMRKRNHREVNPTNNYYDKFYIINYLELGKRWLEVLAEDFEDSMPTFADSDDEEEEESWNEWQEDNTDEDQFRSVCLFCNNNQETVPALLEHMRDNHQFDFLKFIDENKLGTYERAKFINFLRKKVFNTPGHRPDGGSNEASPKPAEVPERSEWDQEEELVPMFGNDHFVWLFESYLEETQGDALKELEEDEKESEKTVDAGGDAKSFSLKKLVDDSKINTIEGVVAEDLPDLSQSVLDKDELYKSLC